jgi:hypothetical protein
MVHPFAYRSHLHVKIDTTPFHLYIKAINLVEEATLTCTHATFLEPIVLL